MSILIRSSVFRVLEGATFGCLATFSVGSGVDVRVRFWVVALGTALFT